MRVWIIVKELKLFGRVTTEILKCFRTAEEAMMFIAKEESDKNELSDYVRLTMVLRDVE